MKRRIWRRRETVINSNVLLHARCRLKIAFSTISEGRKEEGRGGAWNKGNPDAETSIVVLNGERWARKRQCNEVSEPERHNALSSPICFVLKFVGADPFCGFACCWMGYVLCFGDVCFWKISELMCLDWFFCWNRKGWLV